MQISNIEEEIYNKVKKEKQEKYKKNILLNLGDAPLLFMIFLACFSLSISTIFYLKIYFRFDEILEKIGDIIGYEPNYTIFISTFSCLFFLLYLMIFLISLELYQKYKKAKDEKNVRN